MRLKSAFFIVILAAFAMLATPTWADDAQTSLADVAKQKSGTKAKRVITDDDIPSTSGSPLAAQSQPQGSSSSVTGDTDAKEANAKTSGPAGSAKAAASSDLEGELKAVIHDEDLLKKRLQQLREKIEKTPDPFRKQIYEDSIVNQQVTLEEFGKKRKELEQQIADEKAKPKS